jgi:CRP-like cAMP-binding protein
MAEPPVPDRTLALRSGAVLDVPPRTALLLTVGGVVGTGLIVMESLFGNRLETVQTDKLIHFGGYFVLGAVFVLGLPPRWFVPVLLGLAALGVGIEVLQPLNLRSLDWSDAAADGLGLALGAAAGLAVRWAHGYLRTELQEARIRRHLVTYRPGQTLVREGEPADAFLVVKRGTVELYREADGQRVLVDTAGPGEMVGLLAEIQRRPAYATAVATSVVQVYRLDLDALVAAAGGRQQPLGAVLAGLAGDLHQAWERIVALERAGRAG